MKKHLNLFFVVVLLMLSTAGSAEEVSQTKRSVDQNNSPFALYQILVDEFYAMTKDQGQRWQSAFNVLEYEKVLVLSELQDEQDFQRHGEYLQKYIAASKAYLNFLTHLEAKATELFTGYDLTEKQAKPVVANLLTTYQKQKETLISLMGVHIQYGEKMNQLLTFLQTHQKDWAWKAGKIDMEDKDLAKQYNGTIDDIIALEDQIEVYSKALDFQLK